MYRQLNWVRILKGPTLILAKHFKQVLFCGRDGVSTLPVTANFI